MCVMAIEGVVLRAPSTSAPAVEPPRRRAPSTTARRGGAAIRCSSSLDGRAGAAGAAGGVSEDHYRTLRLTPGDTRGEVRKAFRHLALQYHPDVCKESDSGLDFQRINVAYQTVMSNMNEAEERLKYWRLRYGLADEDLDRYRYYLNDEVDDWFDL